VEVDKVIKIPELGERFKSDGLEPIGGSPEFFGAFIRAEIEKYANVIKVAGIPKQ
jgi:tripartite-type tricarboxylate transporter receptor subunit TctC